MSPRSAIIPANSASITHAAALLREGKLVAFPTETVYGLGGDATNDAAVAAIYTAKQRPEINPLIVHVADAHALDSLIRWSDMAQVLAAQFWPGPLTLVLPRREDCKVSLLASAGMDTLAVRVPAHSIARELLEKTGRPVAAPSANISGKLSPTAPLHVFESLAGKVDLILAGGKSEVGIESTVVDLTSAQPRILRPGGITREQLKKVLGLQLADMPVAANETILAPGMLPSHYAPELPVRLNAASASDSEALLAFGPDQGVKGGGMRLNLSPQGDLAEAAANLFAMLRQLDNPRFRRIAVMPVPETGLGVAINDRLRRASVR